MDLKSQENKLLKIVLGTLEDFSSIRDLLKLEHGGKVWPGGSRKARGRRGHLLSLCWVPLTVLEPQTFSDLLLTTKR